jgi:hypothetical protein
LARYEIAHKNREYRRLSPMHGLQIRYRGIKERYDVAACAGAERAAINRQKSGASK